MSPQTTPGTELNWELPVAAGHVDWAGGAPAGSEERASRRAWQSGAGPGGWSKVSGAGAMALGASLRPLRAV